jgi:hypothetical protein
MLHPTLEAAAAKAAESVAREGDLPPDTTGGPAYQASESGVTLSVGLDTSGGRPRVTAARHGGARDTALRGVLDTFCKLIEGLPLQEAADHGAIHTLEALRSTKSPNPVPGVLTPRSAGLAFACCERLMRDILRQHQTETGKQDTRNFWNPPLSTEWRSASDEQRIAILQPKIVAFRAAHGLSEQDIWVAAVEKIRRVIVGFGPAVAYDRKPRLLMELELEVRKATGDRLEFFMDEKTDINKMRRLGPSEETS